MKIDFGFMLHLPWERLYRLVLRKFVKISSSHLNCSTVRLFRTAIGRDS